MILSLLQRICKDLEDSEIEYMISGSIAMITYTVPRMTRDIDIVINLTTQNISTFKKIFMNDYYFNDNTVHEEVIKKGMFNVIDQQTGYKIDFIVRKDSEYRLTEFNRKQKINEFGFPCWIVSKEDLIISKLEWIQLLQSDVQLQDIENLIDTGVDKTYLNFWIKKLGLKTFNLL